MQNIGTGKLVFFYSLWLIGIGSGRLMSCQQPICTGNCTDPAAFTSIKEISEAGREYDICREYSDVDPASVIKIFFNKAAMSPPNAGTDQVNMSVQVNLIKGGTSTPVEVQNYVFKTGTSSEVKFAFQDRPYRPGQPGFDEVPGTEIDLRQLAAANQDEIVVRIANLANQVAVVYRFKPREVGWHVKTTDSVLFVQRQGVSKQDLADGVVKINFAPSPGVTYGGIYVPRSHGFWRVVSPGLGLNLSFLDWKDQSFDSTTGTFPKGTSSSSINVGLGVQASLFNGILQLTYGWNLQADKDRRYLGIGVSFVNITQKLTGLIAIN